jgi:hypothetical protein
LPGTSPVGQANSGLLGCPEISFIELMTPAPIASALATHP